MNRLVSNVNPQELLDPLFPKETLNNQIQHFEGQYEIKLIKNGPTKISDTMADVPVHVVFNSMIGSSNEHNFEEDRDLDFVLRDGHWYFANYNFLNPTPTESLVDIVLLLIAVIWLCVTWLKFNRLRSSRIGGQFFLGLIADGFRALNPFTWYPKDKMSHSGRWLK